MKARHQRLIGIGLVLIGVGLGATFLLRAMNENVLFYYSPSQVASGEAPKNHHFRIGGMVVKGSVKREKDGLTVRFVVTDNAEHTTILYKGILPDLFREGQGIVANGKLRADGVFVASEVLAKHDENYMPPEVAASLKPKGMKTGNTKP